MCRGLAYLGTPILLDDLFYKSDSSLIKQTYLPKKMSKILNLAGFGMTAWHENKAPLIYKTAELPFYDKNLKNLAETFRAKSLIAHIRGVPFSVETIVNQQNTHPFMYENCKIALAHNGVLEGYENMKGDLFQLIKPEILSHVVGSTDSEITYAILLSQLSNPFENPCIEELSQAVIKSLKLIKGVREKHNMFEPSAVNLFISNGEYIVVTRFEFDFGSVLKNTKKLQYVYHSLWYTYGEEYGSFDNEYKMKGQRKRAVMFCSEPLTQDVTTWLEIPEYSIMTAQWQNDEIIIKSDDLNI